MCELFNRYDVLFALLGLALVVWHRSIVRQLRIYGPLLRVVCVYCEQYQIQDVDRQLEYELGTDWIALKYELVEWYVATCLYMLLFAGARSHCSSLFLTVTNSCQCWNAARLLGWAFLNPHTAER
jgi:hypothetical protein